MKKLFVCKKDFSITIYNSDRKEVGFERYKVYVGEHYYRPAPMFGSLMFVGTGRNGYIIDSVQYKIYFGYSKDQECDEHYASVQMIESTFYDDDSKEAISILRRYKLKKLKNVCLK